MVLNARRFRFVLPQTAVRLVSCRLPYKKYLPIYFFVVACYVCINIAVVNIDLFNLAPISIVSSDGNCKCFESQSIDAVYTWVNGSDPQLRNSLANVTNQIILDQLREHCLNLSIPMDNNYNGIQRTVLPVILIRPKLTNPKQHFPKLVKFEDFNKSAILVYFQNTKTAIKHGKNCVRFFEGKVHKISNLYLANSSSSDELQVQSLVKLENITVPNRSVQSDPFKYFSPITRKHLQLLQTENVDQSTLLYTTRLPETNLTKIVALIKSKLNTSINYNFDVHHPIHLKMTDANFFLHQLQHDSVRDNRFADNDELRYSLRSIEKNAPWINNIYIVTNGQIPSWLNLEHPRIKLIKHQDIFVNASHLPTFSSSAIETHIHRIENLSKHFLYFNDDIILARPVYPDDFYTKSRGFKVYLSWPVPNCAVGCPLNWLNDGYCDKPCNSSQCLWDGGDCLNRTIKVEDTASISAPSHQTNQSSRHASDYCSANCLTNWLGDSFCDQVCNKAECAYDMADCGTNHFDQFHMIQFEPSRNIYSYPSNQSVIFLNFTHLTSTQEFPYPIQLKSVTYLKMDFIYSAVLSLQHNALVVLFRPAMPKEDLRFNISASVENILFHFPILVKVGNIFTDFDLIPNVDSGFNLTEIIQNTIDSQTQVIEIMENRTQVPLIWQFDETFFPCDVNVSILPEEIRYKFEQVDKQFHDNLLTKTGKESFYVRLKQLYADLICNSTLNAAISKTIQKNPWFNFFQNNFVNESNSYRSRKLLDAYADSLVFVNHLYNKEFGVEMRKAPAHMAHYVDRDIIYRLQDTFSDLFDKTSSHRIRNSNDMQFAFSYYYFLMSEPKQISIEAALQQFDIDQSRDFSENELKSLFLHLYPLPLKIEHMNEFYEKLNECCNNCTVTTKETHYTKENRRLAIAVVAECIPLKNKILALYSKSKANKYEILNDDDVAFKMLRSNETLLQSELDELRKNMKKFICLNDNFDHNGNETEEKRLRIILGEFYDSLFPLKSQFEHEKGNENKYLYLDQYKEWKRNTTRGTQIYFNISYLFILFNILLLILMIL